MGVAIEVRGLTKSFGSARIWEDVSLTIPVARLQARVLAILHTLPPGAQAAILESFEGSPYGAPECVG